MKTFKMGTTLSAVLAGALLCAAPLRADQSFGDAGDYLRNGAGARPLGMGGAFTAVANDVSAENWNPAALAFLDEYQFITMYAPFVLSSNLFYAGVGIPLGPRGALAASDVMLRSDGFQSANALNQNTGSDSIVHNAVSLSYARAFYDAWSLGGRVRFLQQKVLSDSGNTFGIDLSAYSRPWHRVSAGFSVLNLNRPSITLGSTPDEFRRSIRLGAAFHGPRDSFIVSVDGNKTEGQNLYAAAGLEYTPVPLLSLRGGWDQNQTLTAGVGVNFRSSVRVDYAFSTQQELGDFNKVSLTWRWGNVYHARINPDGIVKETEAIYVEGLRNEVKFRTDVPRFKIVNWSLDIANEEGKKVRALGEPAAPPEVILWDMKDSGGKPVKRGRYQYLFRVIYKNDKVWEEGGHFRLDFKTNQVDGVDVQMRGESLGEPLPPAPPAVVPVPALPLEVPAESDSVNTPPTGAEPVDAAEPTVVSPPAQP